MGTSGPTEKIHVGIAEMKYLYFLTFETILPIPASLWILQFLLFPQLLPFLQFIPFQNFLMFLQLLSSRISTVTAVAALIPTVPVVSMGPKLYYSS